MTTAPERPYALLGIAEDPNLGDLISHALQRQGFDVKATDTPEQTVLAATEQKPHIVVTNYRDQNLVSSQMIQLLKQIRANLPIVLLAEWAEKPMLIHLLLYENVAVLQKPLQIPQLLDALRFFNLSPSHYPGPENRKFRRISARFRVELEGYGEGLAENISAGGMMIQVTQDLKSGMPLKISLSTVSRDPVQAVVVWQKTHASEEPGALTANAQSLVGVRFYELNAENLQLISKFIYKQLKGSPLNPA